MGGLGGIIFFNQAEIEIMKIALLFFSNFPSSLELVEFKEVLITI